MASKSIVKSMSSLKFKRLESVAVPQKVLSQAQNNADFLKEEINKDFHATLSEKMAFWRAEKNEEFKKSDTYQKGLERRERLNIAFKGAYKWLPEFADYFEGCPGVDKIKNIISKKEMETAFNKLRKKGYVTINEDEFARFYDDNLKKVKENYNNNLPAYYLDFLKILTLPLKSGDITEFEAKTKDQTTGRVLEYTSKPVDANTAKLDAKNMRIIKPQEDKSYKKTGKYKMDCINAFQNLRLVFSAYLSIISKIYNYKFQSVENNKVPDEQFKFNEDKLNSVMSTYEKCISNIKTEIKEHPIYFNYIVKHGELEKLDESIDNQRKELQKLIDDAKDVIFDAETLSYTENSHKSTYTGLTKTLKLTSNYINDIAEYISNGEDEKFKYTYNRVLPLLKDDLYYKVLAFQKIQFKQNKNHAKQITECNKKIEKVLESTENIKASMATFEIKFKAQYKNAAKAFAKALIPAVILSGLSISTIWLDVTKPLVDTLKTLSGAVEDARKSLVPTM